MLIGIQLNCHIMMAFGTSYAQASESEVQTVPIKLVYFPLKQCIWWKVDKSTCQLYRQDENFRLEATLSTGHSFQVVKFQELSMNGSHTCQAGRWGAALKTVTCSAGDKQQHCYLALANDQFCFHQTLGGLRLHKSTAERTGYMMITGFIWSHTGI